MSDEPSAADRSVYGAVAGVLESLPKGAYSVELARGVEEATWVTKVWPSSNAAAAIEVSTDGEQVAFQVANTWFEFDLDDDGIHEVELLTECVTLGKFAEAGPTARSFALFGTTEGEISAGAVHLPIPWSWRKHVRTFSPYVASQQ